MADDVRLYVLTLKRQFSAGILHACKAAAKKWLYAVSSQVMARLAISVSYP
jgi:hypothetical protein